MQNKTHGESHPLSQSLSHCPWAQGHRAETPPRAPCDWPLLSHSPNLVPQLLSLKAQQALTELKADGI